jgi:hypothetical protein
MRKREIKVAAIALVFLVSCITGVSAHSLYWNYVAASIPTCSGGSNVTTLQAQFRIYHSHNDGPQSQHYEVWVDGILQITTALPNHPATGQTITYTISENITFPQGNHTIRLSVISGDQWNTNMTVTGKNCEIRIETVNHANVSISPLAQTNITKATELLKVTQELLSQAKEKNLDTSTCEKLIDEANADLTEAKMRLTSPITANYYALHAFEKLTQAIECLKALVG